MSVRIWFKPVKYIATPGTFLVTQRHMDEHKIYGRATYGVPQQCSGGPPPQTRYAVQTYDLPSDLPYLLPMPAVTNLSLIPVCLASLHIRHAHLCPTTVPSPCCIRVFNKSTSESRLVQRIIGGRGQRGCVHGCRHMPDANPDRAPARQFACQRVLRHVDHPSETHLR